MTDPKDCLATWEIDSRSSVLRELRSVGPHRGDFFGRYPAAEIDTSSQQPLQCVSRFRLAGIPILWLTSDKQDVVVDRRFSSDLVAVDVPRLTPGRAVSVGRLTPAARSLPPRHVLEFLVRSDVLRTYWHVGSEVCLSHESAEGRAYRAEAHGVHTYFTNGRRRDAFAFVFELSPDGDLVVTGKPVP